MRQEPDHGPSDHSAPDTAADEAYGQGAGRAATLRSPPPGRMALLRAGAWPLTLKFTLILLLVAMVPTLLVTVTNLRGGIEGVADTERDNLELGAQGLARQLDQLIEGHRGIARVLAQEPDVHTLLEQGDAASPALRETIAYRLGLMQQANPDLSNLYLMNARGELVVSPDLQQVGLARPFREYFSQAMLGKEYTSNLLRGMRTSEPGVYFSAPVWIDGRVAGAAVSKLKGQAIDGILRSVDDDFTAFLVDGDGVLIDHPSPDWLYKTLLPLPKERIDAIQAVSQFPADALTPLGGEGLGDGMAFTQPGNVTFRHLDNEPWIAGVAPLEEHNWRVYLAEPQSRFSAPIEALFWRSIATTALIGLLVLITAGVLGRAMTRPILALTRAANQLKLGQYAQASAGQDLLAVSQRTDELGALAQVFRAMNEEVYRREFSLDQEVQARTGELADKTRLLEESYQRLDEELRLARDMQQAFLPQSFPQDSRFRLHGSMTPAREMGGDFYDEFPLAGGRYGLIVADVAGKGVPAAFFMAVSRTVLQDVALTWRSPGTVLSRANDLLCQRNPMELFVTVFYAVYDPADGSLAYASAGHLPPLLRHADGSVHALEVAREMVLGAMPGQSYTELRRVLAPGDLLLMYTDGITEAFSPQGEEFGEARLRQWLRTLPVSSSPEQAMEALETTLSSFIGDAEPTDDVTGLLLHVGGTESRWRADWRIASQVDKIAALADAIETRLHDGLAGVQDDPATLAFQVNLCIDELVTNIIRHGLRQDPTRFIDITLARDCDWLQVTIRDDAPAFDSFNQATPPDINLDVSQRPVGGLGVHLVRSLMDTCHSTYDGRGNMIVLRKHLAPTTPQSTTSL